MQFVLWFATMIRWISKTVLEVNQRGEAKLESVLFNHGDGLARLGLSNHHACDSSLCTILSTYLQQSHIRTRINK
jgi:hypothetical protein